MKLSRLILALPLLLVGCGMGFENNAVQPATFTSNGERIYFTGRSSSGDPIQYRGGTMHSSMHKTACADCHGAEREGKRLYPRFWLKAPALTPEAMSRDHGDGHSHTAYNDASVKRAIVEGVNPDGHPLDYAMPRWEMTPEDLDDLTRYLMTPVRRF